MATGFKTSTAPVKPGPEVKDRDRQLRRDRFTGIVVLVLIALLTALMIWLASLSGSAPDNLDYWQMMP